MLNVFPKLPFPNQPYALFGDIESSGKLRESGCAGQDRDYGGFGKFGSSNFFSFKKTNAVLSGGIFHIVIMSANKEMGWFNTGWNIAGMTHFHSVRKWPEVQYPRCPRSIYCPSVRISSVNTAVTNPTKSPEPKPTSFRYFHFAPKPMHERGRKSLRREELCPIVRPLDKLHRLNRVGSGSVSPLAGAFR